MGIPPCSRKPSAFRRRSLTLKGLVTLSTAPDVSTLVAKEVERQLGGRVRPWVRLSEAAEYTGYSVQFLRVQCQRGVLRHTKPGGNAIRVRRDELDRFMDCRPPVEVKPSGTRRPRKAKSVTGRG